MREYHVINPAAGKGLGARMAPAPEENKVIYHTAGVGDAREYLAKALRSETETVRVFIYGGDGTVGEAVNGILDAGAAERVLLTAVPAGTGNDLVRIFSDDKPGVEYRMDLLRCPDGKCVINMINIGFDCAAAGKAAEWKKKPLIRGKLAYIMGVLDVLCHPLGTHMTVTYEDESGNTHTKKGKYLLCSAANAQYCGGGFRAAPTARINDGIAELLLVPVLSRISFIRLIGDYHNGTHIGPDGRPTPKLQKYMEYIRCRKAAFTGMSQICRDGEIEKTEDISFEILPGAIRYMT